MLSPLQIGLLVAAAIYSGGFGWQFVGRPSLAKKIGWFALFAAVAGIVWFLTLPREMPLLDLIPRLGWLAVPLIPATALVISLWVCGLYSARWMVRKFRPQFCSASGWEVLLTEEVCPLCGSKSANRPPSN